MNKLRFYFSLAVSGLIVLSSCSEATEQKSINDNAEELLKESKEAMSNTDEQNETVITSDEASNLDSTIVTNDNGSMLETTASTEENQSSKTDVDDYDFHEYKDLNALLSTYVSYSGKVNYGSIKANKSQLDDITKEFESNFPGASWSSAQKLTYWINAYNVYTIQLIVDNYPTSSITKITAKPWRKSFIKLNGNSYSLNQIENDIIRKQFNEPRVHFALNCASESCPVLLNKAYTPSTVYGKMTSQTKRFLKDTSKNTYGETEVQISQIFDWYSEDFTKGGKTVFDFINKYRTEQLDNQTTTYQEYSWDLND